MKLMQLEAIRIRCGLTQMQLAQKSGVSQGKISEYEAGKAIPRLDTALKIAVALDVHIEDLIYSDGENRTVIV